jgi:dihydropteroate synthase
VSATFCGRPVAGDRALIMAIVNRTPDSFYDRGATFTDEAAKEAVHRVVAEGADVIDIGGVKAGPGITVDADEELTRVVPFIEWVRAAYPQQCISVDTWRASVAKQACAAGADIINDVWALRQNGALAVVAQHPRCGVCLMHMHRDPQTMQVAPMQGGVIEPVKAFLRERAQAVREAGVADSRVVLDPGIGFGKTVEQNFELLSRQSALLDMGLPILAGWSRKSSLGAVTGQSVAADRVAASLAAAVLALERGARVLRVHDVAPTVQAAAVWRAAQAR